MLSSPAWVASGIGPKVLTQIVIVANQTKTFYSICSSFHFQGYLQQNSLHTSIHQKCQQVLPKVIPAEPLHMNTSRVPAAAGTVAARSQAASRGPHPAPRPVRDPAQLTPQG